MPKIRFARFLFTLFIFVIFFSSALKVSASTIVDADIAVNTTWTQNGSPYIIKNDIRVPSGVTLSIDPGVVVKFDDDFSFFGISIEVSGKLIANGEETNKIYFTSNYDDEIGGNTDDEEFCYKDRDEQGNALGEVCESFDLGDPLAGDWDEIYFLNSTGSSMSNVSFRYAYYASTIESSDVYLQNLNVTDGIKGLQAYENSHVTISDAVFDVLEEHALEFYEDVSLIFNDIKISNIFDTPIYISDNSSFTGKNLKIENIFSNYVNAINLADNSSFVVENLRIENILAEQADVVEVLNNSDLSIKDSYFKNCPSEACITVFDYANYSANPSSINIENTVFDGGLGSGLLNFSNSNSLNVKNSSFQNFSLFAIKNRSTFAINAQNNFWGDASGPKNEALNPNGLGESIYGNVSFAPWLENYPPVSCCSSVLFLPGLEASRLYAPRENGSEDQLWESNGNSDVEYLYLNADGTSKNPNIYTRDIIKETNTPIPLGGAGQNIYKSFSKMMDTLFDERKIGEWKEFAYDWRQSVDDIVSNGTKYQNGNVSLVAALQSLVDSPLNKNGKVTIVAHSNGGLLAKALLKKLQDEKAAGINNLIDKVDVLILVAVPEIGTAVALPAMLHGYDQSILGGWIIDKTRARELGRNMLGAFGLLPSREYINRVSAAPATFVDTIVPSNVTTKLVQAFGSAISSYDEYKSFLFGEEGRTSPPINQTKLPISLSPSLFAKAETLHDSIDAFTPPSSLRVIEVAGWGLDTVASFEYYPKICAASLGCGFTLDENPRFTVDGDKTVIAQSAQYMSFLGKAEKYWVNLFQINNDKFPLAVNSEHKNIFEVNQINNFISSIIEKKDIILDAVLTDSEPIDDSNRLRLSIHSPATIDAYDADGNHTGKICPPTSDFCYVEENIPNSSYLEFGEGKYLNLPEDKMESIRLQGTGAGTFTYESEKVLPDGTSAVSSFADIPVTMQTEAEITLNRDTQTPELALDVTGDGVTDFTLTPNAAFDPVAYLEIMKATADSFDFLQTKEYNFSSRIDNIIRQIQKGKINEAKSKTKKFKFFLEKEVAKLNLRHPKPRKLSKTDAQLLLDMLNKLLDNMN